MRSLTLLLILSLLLVHVSPSSGDWFYGFDDGVIPDSFTVRGVDESIEVHTDTMQASAEGGMLRMWDTLSPSSGGTGGSDAFNGEVFHGNVRVSAEINSAGTSNDWIGVNAGATEPFIEDTSFYWAAVNFDQNNENFGLLHVAKGLGDRNESISSTWRIPDANRSYFIELEVTNNLATGFPDVSGRLFDHAGGILLTEVSMTDTNIGGVPPATTGRAGTVAWTGGSDLFDATFDNIRAESLPVPEPSTLLLCIVALCIVGGWRKLRLGGLMAVLLLSMSCGNACAATIFHDNFADGDAEDGMPVTWVPVSAFPGVFDASSGDYAVTTSSSWSSAVSGVPTVELTDTSIRSQVRITSSADDHDSIGLQARGELDDYHSYLGGIGANGKMYLNLTGNGEPLLGTAWTDLQPTLEDVLLQIDAIGHAIKVWAWRPGEPMPVNPQISVIDTDLNTGLPHVIVDTWESQTTTGVFRFVHVADVHIPEPSTAILCAIAMGIVGVWWKWEVK